MQIRAIRSQSKANPKPGFAFALLRALLQSHQDQKFLIGPTVAIVAARVLDVAGLTNPAN